MALKVWLPLNKGTFDNKGLYLNPNITSGTYSFDNNGKTGKCLKASTTVETNIPLSEWDFTNKSVSMGCWIKMNFDEMATVINAQTYDSDYTVAGGSIIGRCSYGGYALRWQTNNIYTSGSFSSINLYSSLRSSSQMYTTNNFNITANEWTHIFTVFDREAGKLLLYKNGNLYSTTNLDMTKLTPELFTTGLGSFNIHQTSTDGGVKRSVSAPFYINDVRVYDEALSPKQIKEISKGLVAHYKLDNINNSYNMIINGFGEFGNMGWSNSSNISTTEIPTGVPGVKASFYSGNSTINDSRFRIPICVNHSYTISAYIKSSGATSGNTYPSIYPYDIDKKFIQFYHCRDGFQTATLTTLAQPLNPGDTVISATDLSQWNTGDNYLYHVAIFGYQDSTGYVYPDLEYTQDSPTFGTKTDKSHINKTNNTITLNSAYTGVSRPVGTKIVQSGEGSTYYYPFGRLSLANLSNWTYKTATFTPMQINRLRYAKYWTYSTDNNTYHAGIKLIDNDIAEANNGKNLIYTLQAGGHTSVNSNKIVTDGVDADTYFWVRTDTLTEGKKYLFQMTVSGLPSDTTYRWAINNNESVGIMDLVNGVNTCIFTCPNLNDFTKLLIDDKIRPSGYNYQLTFSDIKLFNTEGYGLQDMSGYGNNGSIIGDLKYTIDSPRYDGCMYFPGDATITHPLTLDNSNQEWTCMAWIKLVTNAANCQLNNMNLGNRIQHNSGGNALLYLNSGTNDYYKYSNTVIPLDTWTHIAFVCKNSDQLVKIYINGVDRTGTGPDSGIPGGLNSIITIGTNFDGYMSDYREYATALSADEILTMYKNSGIIDNKGNVYAYEFKEE